MSQPDAELLAWAAHSLGVDVTVVRGLREGGAPWLLDAGARSVVLRVAGADDVDLLAVENLGLAFARQHGVPVPAVLAARLAGDRPALLLEAIPGSSAIPVEAPVARLRALGAIAATLNSLAVPTDSALPRRDRPIAGVDFDALRAAAAPQPLLVRGERAMREHPVGGPDGFVHGDLWQGNAMWDGDRLCALIDWDCAGVGPAGVDLGSMRFDAAMCFGLPAAEHVLAGWTGQAGRAADAVAYWDVVAALSSPPDLGWFVSTIVDQGRPDLSRELMIERRDAFLEAALNSL